MTSNTREGNLGQAQAAIYAGVSERTLENLRQRGDGPPFAKIGRRVVYPLAGLDAWLTEHLVRSTAEARARVA